MRECLPGAIGFVEHTGALLGFIQARLNSPASSAFLPPQLRQVRARRRSIKPRAVHGVVPAGDVDNAGADELDMFPADPRQLEHQPSTQTDRPYFEVLVVEKMTEAQERSLRNEVRKWRRPDDEFVYELVVVASGDEALIAAASQRKPAGRGDPPALFAPIDPGPVQPGGVRR